MPHQLLEKGQRYYNKKRIAITLAFCLLTGCLTGAGEFCAGVLAAEESTTGTVTMTEIYNNGNYMEAPADQIVTIASKEELEMFRGYVEAGKVTEEREFHQIADVTISDYTFIYDKESERVGFYLEEELVGAVDESRCVYKDYTAVEETTLKSLGITSSEQQSWEPIGDEDSKTFFQGIYDGNGYAIEGLWSISAENWVGLFSKIPKGEVREVNITSSFFLGNYDVGAIAGNAGTNLGDKITIKNCQIKTIIVGGANSGGITGVLNGGDITITKNSASMRNCIVQGVIKGKDDVGGCIGTSQSTEVSFCKFTGEESEIEGTNISGGGIAGVLVKGTINNCANYGSVRMGTGAAGGIVGSNIGYIVEDHFVESEVWQCENYGEISSGDRSGGIVGDLNVASVNACLNAGEVIGFPAGGIVGYGYDDAWIVNCENRGNTLGINQTAGGIVGHGGDLNVQNCLNKEKIGKNEIIDFLKLGGILGTTYVEDNTVIQNCLNLADLDGFVKLEDVYGEIGNISGAMYHGTVKHCYYPSGELSCLGSEGANESACYPVTGSQIRGTEQNQRISEEEDSRAYTTSVVKALNNGVAIINEVNAEKDTDVIILETWKYDEEGLPTICDIGVGDMEPEITEMPNPTAEPTPSPTVEPTPSPTEEPTETPMVTLLPTKSPEITISPPETSSPTLEPTISPTEEPTETPMVTLLPTKSPEITISPSETPSPTVEPTPEPTLEPTISPTVEPTPSPTVEPTPSPTVEPTPSPTIEPTPEPTPAPTLGATMEPTGTPAPMTESTSSPVPELTTMAPQESPTISSGNVNYQTQKVTGFKAAAKAPKKVKLSWNPVENATGYEIYRSTKKKSGYKLVQTIGAKTGWTDKELKKGKKYFYKVCAIIGTGSNLVQGKMSAAKKVKLPWHTTPKVSYKKGVTPDNTRYLTIRLKKYQGTHIEILARTKKGKFKKISLSNSQIKENHGIFGLSYTKQRGVLYCKVRTYSTTKKKKRCSLYTKVRKIRL